MDSQLQVKDSVLEYSDQNGKQYWSLPIPSIVLISEYTTREGPYFEDYFLVFVTLEKNELYFHTASFYASGRDETLATIKKILTTTFDLQFASSTEWDSRVMWPEEMADSKYFEFKPVHPETFLQKIQKKIFGSPLEYKIAKPIWQYLQKIKEAS